MWKNGLLKLYPQDIISHHIHQFVREYAISAFAAFQRSDISV